MPLLGVRSGRPQDHLTALLEDFEQHSIATAATLPWRAPRTLIYQSQEWQKSEHSAKTLLRNIERRVFAQTRVTAYRLAA